MKDLTETVRRMGDLTLEFKRVNEKITNTKLEADRIDIMKREWLPLNESMVELERQLDEAGVKLGSAEFFELLHTIRPDVYSIIEKNKNE